MLRAELKEGMNAKEFDRKVTRLNAAADGNELTSTVSTVTDAERRALTRTYRKDVTNRIKSFYADNPEAMQNALNRLRTSDIDHIRDLQLGGQNVRSNLKALDSSINRSLGSQISHQLAGKATSTPIIRIQVDNLR